MRAVIQRVKEASVSVSGEVLGKINHGYLIYLGIETNDNDDDLAYMVKKVEGLRVFQDEEDKMNLNLEAVGGELLVISQFTLYGDVRKGNRPSFVASANVEKGLFYYEAFCKRLREDGYHVEMGQFQSDMKVFSINDGPVTILLDSNKAF